LHSCGCSTLRLSSVCRGTDTVFSVVSKRPLSSAHWKQHGLTYKTALTPTAYVLPKGRISAHGHPVASSSRIPASCLAMHSPTVHPLSYTPQKAQRKPVLLLVAPGSQKGSLAACPKMTLAHRKEGAPMPTPSPNVVPDTSSWELCICSTPRCQRQHWYVQRYDELRDVWRVTLTPGDAGWLVAASGPVCPFCGAPLLPPEHGGTAVVPPSSWS
jgi:hypothetical protein